MPSEKKILTDFLTLFKDSPCLWDNRNVMHSNREAREKAYEILLETYKQIHEDATILDVKRKIENMRCTFKREHKKVLVSRLNGDILEYVPSLWYYDLMTFLNDVCEYKLDQGTRNRDNSSTRMDEEISVSTSKRKRHNTSAVYLPDTQDQDSDYDDNESGNHNSMILNNNSKSSTTHLSESESFGTTIGLQLKELESMQRAIAEKLISDVIFQARFNRLQMNSVISTDDKINSDCF